MMISTDAYTVAVNTQKLTRQTLLDLCVHLQLVCESSNFTRSSVPLIESLKNNAHLIIDARKRKNLTHLQSILLFKDSSLCLTISFVSHGKSDIGFLLCHSSQLTS